ncbi:MAG TPA: type 2 isopentenyl-diphosphate Delta-isomerase [Candidatus Tumulicola sp.]|nr:type 2 isopentenyl-diphosphate Delta-isomerase [Candidatus Tumulicola sp.]
MSPPSEPASTPSRKAQHLQINVERDVAAKGVDAGFAAYAFVPKALPEIDLEEVDLSTRLLGRTLRAPLLISCMTGGTPEATRVNRTLAAVAQRFGLAMGLGSGRALLESAASLPTFDVRPIAPDVLLLANLGAVQLNRGYGADDCRRLVDLLRADGLALHLNALQEALQPEGDTCFRGLLREIAALCSAVDFPVIVKEVGWGIPADDVRALADAGVAAVDVAGAGGTSWSEVERHRTPQPWRGRVAAEFAGWGIPTADCLVQARAAAPEATLIASGGIRSGLDAAKALALGAAAAGVAGPFLRAAYEGEGTAADLASAYVETLRVALFSVGARTPAELRAAGRLVRQGTVPPNG